MILLSGKLRWVCSERETQFHMEFLEFDGIMGVFFELMKKVIVRYVCKLSLAMEGGGIASGA